MLTYLIIIVWLFSRYLATMTWNVTGFSSLKYFLPTLAEWLDYLNPFYLVWAPYLTSGSVSLPRHLVFLAVCLVISGGLVSLATFRIRAVTQSQGKRRAARAGRFRLSVRLPRPQWLSRLPGPSLDGNPVFWREWYRSKPSRMMRVVWVLYWSIGFVWVILAADNVFTGAANHDMIAIMNVFQVGVGLLLLSVDAATSLIEERVARKPRHPARHSAFDAVDPGWEMGRNVPARAATSLRPGLDDAFPGLGERAVDCLFQFRGTAAGILPH